MKRIFVCLHKSKFTLYAIVFLVTINIAFSQNPQNDKEFVRAMGFVKQNRRIDALPLFEKLSLRYPNDAEVQANFGISILANSTTIKDEVFRRKEVERGVEILRKAKKLGTDNVIALEFLDAREKGFEIGLDFSASSKEVEDAIREGEAFFGRGEFDKAFKSYQRAYKLDPKNYNAALFSGDCFYSQKRYADSEVWFEKAVAIDRNREQAFRFWGDALVNQGKLKESLTKYAQAVIAAPTSRLPFNALVRATQDYGARRGSPFILIPSIDSDEIVIDTASLIVGDGSIHWAQFTETRKVQIERFSSVAIVREFRSTVSDDVEALRSVANAASVDLKKNKSLVLSKSLENLIKLDAIGLLDVYVILFIRNSTNSSEYESFREKNRERMVRFLVDYFAEDKL